MLNCWVNPHGGDSVQVDKSLRKDPGTHQSNVASIICHLCGAKFKVWHDLINHFVAHIRGRKREWDNK